MTKVVCIGGSAGALGPIELILSKLRAPLVVPVIVVLHRRASHPDALVETLQGRIDFPIVGVEDRTPLHPGTIYICPGGYHCLVGTDSLVLTLEPPEHFCIPSIDAVFETAADQFGPEAAVVALSCANEDGALGALRVQQSGGTVLVQDRRTASHPVLIDAATELVPSAIPLSPTAIAAWINGLTLSPDP